jgi:hypothetical protein
MSQFLSVPTADRARPTRRTGAAARQRTWSRIVHLGSAGVLGTYIYAPAAIAEPLHVSLEFGVVPAITLTGLFLWKQAQIRGLLRRRRPGGRPQQPQAPSAGSSENRQERSR